MAAPCHNESVEDLEPKTLESHSLFVSIQVDDKISTISGGGVAKSFFSSTFVAKVDCRRGIIPSYYERLLLQQMPVAWCMPHLVSPSKLLLWTFSRVARCSLVYKTRKS